MRVCAVVLWSVLCVRAEEVMTNDIAWRAVAGWRQQVEAGLATEVIAALDEERDVTTAL